MPTDSAKNEPAVVQGEFFTDGTKFIFRLAGLPYSGVGDSPSAAFEDLMRVERQGAPLTSILRQHARDAEGEATRKLIIRWVSIGLSFSRSWRAASSPPRRFCRRLSPMSAAWP